MTKIMGKSILCSNCFKGFGLKSLAEQIGSTNGGICPNCGSHSGVLLDSRTIRELCDRYFVDGSYNRVKYGGSPILMMVGRDFEFGFDYNAHKSLLHDLNMILEKAGMKPTAYGPAMWRVGITDWMDRLSSSNWKRRDKAIEELIDRCGIKEIGEESQFYRIRANVGDCVNVEDYDAPRFQPYNGGRLNVRGSVVFYASFNVETCIHECRVSMEDTLHLATLEPCRTLRLLDLSDIKEVDSEMIPFEFLPLAVSQLFMAGRHSYGITRRLSMLAKNRGFDGIIYPSYFNSVTKKPSLNIALYGQVIKNKIVRVKSLDRILLNKVSYEFEYGPCMS